MTTREFNETISRLIHEEPFRPFLVHKIDGSIIEIRHRGVALSGEGDALHITAGADMVEFDCSEVRAIVPKTPEVAA